MSQNGELHRLPPNFCERSSVEQSLLALSLAVSDSLSLLSAADEMSGLLQEVRGVIRFLDRADNSAANFSSHSPTKPLQQPKASKFQTLCRPALVPETNDEDGLSDSSRYLVAACRALSEEALGLLHRAAAEGSRCAAVEHAIAVANGTPGNLDLALETLDAAVAIGHPGAMLAVANCLREGRGVPKDYTSCVHWLSRAAENGYVLAQHELAELYEGGFAEGGVERSLPLALRWYKRAAMLGYAPSALNLGKMMLLGSGVDVGELATMDPLTVPSWRELLTKSTYWLSRAAHDGNAEARQLVDRINRDSGKR
jgi:hypothetical protein